MQAGQRNNTFDAKHIRCDINSQKIQDSPSNLERTIKKPKNNDEKNVSCDNQTNKMHQTTTEKSLQTLLVHNSGHLITKQQPHLTPQQRKVVEDISKLFSPQPSKPTKLLIRLNQTQTNRGSKSNQSSESGSENRLQKIQIMRLNQHGEPRTMEFMKLPNQSASIQVDFKSKDSNSKDLPVQSSIRLSNCEEEPIKSHGERFALSKQVSIMYIPDLNISTLIGMKNPPQIFNRFNKKIDQRGQQTIGSNFSYDLMEGKEKDEPMIFTKLLQLDLFRKRKEIEHHRSEELLHANQKLLSAHLVDKQNLQKSRILLQNMEQQYKKVIEQLKAQMEEDKKVNQKLLQSAQSRQKLLVNIKKLNEQYLKENNQLKAKIKQYIKDIHELKLYIATKEQQPDENFKKHHHEPANDKKKTAQMPTFHIQTTTINEDKNITAAKSQKKQTKFSQVQQQKRFTSEIFEASPYYSTLNDEKLILTFAKLQSKPPMLSNCRSQGLLHRIETNRDHDDDNKQRVSLLTSRSQKATGIKKNTLNHDPISPSTRNLVRINRVADNDEPVDKLKDNKSLSNYSNLSGKSLSQRIGYIVKPTANEKGKGMLVDYMIEDPIPEKEDQKGRKNQSRFHYKRQV